MSHKRKLLVNQQVKQINNPKKRKLDCNSKLNLLREKYKNKLGISEESKTYQFYCQHYEKQELNCLLYSALCKYLLRFKQMPNYNQQCDKQKQCPFYPNCLFQHKIEESNSDRKICVITHTKWNEQWSELCEWNIHTECKSNQLLAYAFNNLASQCFDFFIVINESKEQYLSHVYCLIKSDKVVILDMHFETSNLDIKSDPNILRICFRKQSLCVNLYKSLPNVIVIPIDLNDNNMSGLRYLFAQIARMHLNSFQPKYIILSYSFIHSLQINASVISPFLAWVAWQLTHSNIPIIVLDPQINPCNRNMTGNIVFGLRANYRQIRDSLNISELVATNSQPEIIDHTNANKYKLKDGSWVTHRELQESGHSLLLSDYLQMQIYKYNENGSDDEEGFTNQMPEETTVKLPDTVDSAILIKYLQTICEENKVHCEKLYKLLQPGTQIYVLDQSINTQIHFKIVKYIANDTFLLENQTNSPKLLEVQMTGIPIFSSITRQRIV